ncbi:hypothetical protein H6P81_013384 [Aristolochia fimbriata]|uniref:Aminotransferase-like plant mobile domain-containing protein n=1 Tax=Aristolochia fimbriata TaxID=158543 RepID=A0AAV7EHR3_ARIFI|nr:hypothetical protein H6P81_013384 [Aristolochia fimbriata]
MDINAGYMNTMDPGLDEDNVPPHVGVGVDQRFMSKDALQMAWRARNKVLVVVFGVSEELYNLLPQFFKAIKDTNPVRGMPLICIISDSHIGIIRAVADVFSCPHRHKFCIQHIIANLKKCYSVKDFDKMVWRRDRTTQVTTRLCPSVDAHLWTIVEDVRHLHVVAYSGGIFQAVCGVIHYDFHQLTSEYYYASTNLRVYERAFDVPRRRSTWVQEGPERVLMRGLVVVLMRGLVVGCDGSDRDHLAWRERWRSETNTFHLANGEMTITLEDAAILLELRLDGFAVTSSTRGDWMELGRAILGVEHPPSSFQGGRLSLAWIRGRFAFCPDAVIQQHARAYLLHLVGSMIFSECSA